MRFGATFTSQGIVEAVKDALYSSGKTGKAAPDISRSQTNLRRYRPRPEG